MDLNENVKDELRKLVSGFMELVPLIRDAVVNEINKSKLTRLGDFHAEANNVFPNCFTGTQWGITAKVGDQVQLNQQFNCIKRKAYNHNKNPFQILSTVTYKNKIESDCEMWLTNKVENFISLNTKVVFEKVNTKSIGSVACVIKDLNPTTSQLITQWAYKQSPELSMGMEIGVQAASPLSPNIAVSARYETPSYTVSSTIGVTGFQVRLYKQLCPDLHMATTLTQGNIRRVPATVGLALHKTYQNGSDLKMFVNSNSCGGFTFQRNVIVPNPNNEDLKVLINASMLLTRQGRFRFGLGFTLRV